VTEAGPDRPVTVCCFGAIFGEDDTDHRSATLTTSKTATPMGRRIGRSTERGSNRRVSGESAVGRDGLYAGRRL